MIKFFDGHNDSVLRLFLRDEPDAWRRFLEGEEAGHIDLPRARAGGFAGGFFALYSPSRTSIDLAAMRGVSYDCPLPPEVELDDARSSAFRQFAYLHRIAAESGGQITICRTTDAVSAAIEAGRLAIVVHLEGAEAIDARLDTLEVMYAAGLRSLGPVWSRTNIFGHGVPHRFPGDPDTGPGLTDLGKDLVRACNRLGIQIDLSHLTEKGFWDIAAISTHPLVATHSNVHSICPHPRNLTARQLAAIRESDGLVGVNLATSFLRPDGQMVDDVCMDVVVRHFDALIEALGESRVALGSDYDGAIIPGELRSVADSQRIFQALAAKGYDDDLLEKLAWKNWLRVMRAAIG